MRLRLTKTMEGRYEWLPVVGQAQSLSTKKNIQGEDLTVSGYIQKYGGIKSSYDGSVHTSERSYSEHLKRNNLVIKDW